MLACSAQPSSTISRPQKGRMGQKPRAAIRPPMVKDTKHRPAKKPRAPRTLSEQLGEISMLCTAPSTNKDATPANILCKSKTYMDRGVRSMERMWNNGERRPERCAEPCEVLSSALELWLDRVGDPVREPQATGAHRFRCQQRMVQAPQT